jgi:hypothetical protein
MRWHLNIKDHGSETGCTGVVINITEQKSRYLTIGRSLQYLLSCIDYRYDVHFSLFIVSKYPIMVVICGFHI